jgi:hypothetical protein
VTSPSLLAKRSAYLGKDLRRGHARFVECCRDIDARPTGARGRTELGAPPSPAGRLSSLHVFVGCCGRDRLGRQMQPSVGGIAGVPAGPGWGRQGDDESDDQEHQGGDASEHNYPNTHGGQGIGSGFMDVVPALVPMSDSHIAIDPLIRGTVWSQAVTTWPSEGSGGVGCD